MCGLLFFGTTCPSLSHSAPQSSRIISVCVLPTAKKRQKQMHLEESLDTGNICQVSQACRVCKLF